MASTIQPLGKVLCTSRFSLEANAFDIVNYNNKTNLTLSADTPKGVLGGSVAAMAGNPWEAGAAASVTFATPQAGRTNRITHIAKALGLFGGNSEGNAFENAPAAASGIVPIYMNGGLFEIYVFESHAEAGTSQLSTYALGGLLYCSPWGLITCEAPTTQDGTATFTDATGTDVVIALCTKVPSASDLRLGLKLLV
jgi:hypothetical protein